MASGMEKEIILPVQLKQVLRLTTNETFVACKVLLEKGTLGITGQKNLFKLLEQSETLALLPAKSKVLSRYINKMKDDEGNIQAILKPIRYKLSDAQRRFYFGVCCITVMSWYKNNQGERITKDEVYAMDLISYGTKPVIKSILDPTKGKRVDILVMEGKTLSQMNTLEGTDFLEHVLNKWAKVGCYIPEPRKHNFITEFLDD